MVKILIGIHLAGWFIYMFIAWYQERGRPTTFSNSDAVCELIIGFTWEFSIVPGLLAAFIRATLGR